MKKKNIVFKLIFVVFILSFVLFTSNLKIYAIDDIIQGADDFLDKSSGSILKEESIKEVSDTLFSIFSIAGTAFVVVVGVILGIQFIMGSVTEKAEVKQKLIPYAIGSSVIFGATIIWSIVANVLTGIFE